MKWEGSVHEIFQKWVERSPHQLAVADSDVRWSYIDVDRKINWHTVLLARM